MVQSTICAHWLSPSATAGPSGSLEMMSGQDRGLELHAGRERGELRSVGRPHLTLACLERRVQFVVRGELERGERDAQVGEDGVEVGQRGGAGLHADRGVGHVVEGCDAAVGGNHEALAVEEVGVQEGGLLATVAAGGPGGVADQHVDLARLERREALGGFQRLDLDLGGVTEYRSAERPAEVDVEARCFAGCGVDAAEAGQAVVAAAVDDAASLHGSEHAAALGHLDGVGGGDVGGVTGGRVSRVCGVVVAATGACDEGQYGDGAGSALPTMGGDLVGHNAS